MRSPQTSHGCYILKLDHTIYDLHQIALRPGKGNRSHSVDTEITLCSRPGYSTRNEYTTACLFNYARIHDSNSNLWSSGCFKWGLCHTTYVIQYIILIPRLARIKRKVLCSLSLLYLLEQMLVCDPCKVISVVDTLALVHDRAISRPDEPLASDLSPSVS
jgi:hypothetical protein